MRVHLFESYQPYAPVALQMRTLTCARVSGEPNRLWLMEHSPVFTQGQAGKAEHILNPHGIPVVQSDRGGQVTYHGPGLLMFYMMMDLNAMSLGVRDFVCRLEQWLIDFLQEHYTIDAHRQPKAPGVYVQGAKIASIGLRVRKGYSYHGICLNVAGDLTPFSYINPCGYAGLSMTQIRDFVPEVSTQQVRMPLVETFAQIFHQSIASVEATNALEGIVNVQDA